MRKVCRTDARKHRFRFSQTAHQGERDFGCLPGLADYRGSYGLAVRPWTRGRMKGTFDMPRQPPDRASLDQLMESIEADDAEYARLLLDRNPDLRARIKEPIGPTVNSNGTENWNRIVIRRVFLGLGGRNRPVSTRFLPELDV